MNKKESALAVLLPGLFFGAVIGLARVLGGKPDNVLVQFFTTGTNGKNERRWIGMRRFPPGQREQAKDWAIDQAKKTSAADGSNVVWTLESTAEPVTVPIDKLFDPLTANSVGAIEDDYHGHECQHCGRVWSHSTSGAGSHFGAHACPRCGATQLRKMRNRGDRRDQAPQF